MNEEKQIWKNKWIKTVSYAKNINCIWYVSLSDRSSFIACALWRKRQTYHKRYLSTSSTFSRMHFRCQNDRKNLWTGMEIWRDLVLYPVAFYRCNCIHHLSVNGIMPAGRKDYICKNAFRVMSELTGSVSNPYVISLCI